MAIKTGFRIKCRGCLEQPFVPLEQITSGNEKGRFQYRHGDPDCRHYERFQPDIDTLEDLRTRVPYLELKADPFAPSRDVRPKAEPAPPAPVTAEPPAPVKATETVPLEPVSTADDVPDFGYGEQSEPAPVETVKPRRKPRRKPAPKPKTRKEQPDDERTGFELDAAFR